MLKNQILKFYIIFVIVLTLLRIQSFENMVTCCLAMILSLLIVKDEK